MHSNLDGHSGDYSPDFAERTCRKRHEKKLKRVDLTSNIIELIKFLIVEDYSPEQVVGYW